MPAVTDSPPRPVPRPPTPPGFAAHAYEQTWSVPHPRAAVWAWLCSPATFTEGQVPPYRVEFLVPPGGAAFAPGVLNAHHGPGILFAGAIGEVVAPAPGVTAYRDLAYGYGSYALSLRLARPTRLQFWAGDDGPDRTAVRVRLDADVAAWFVPAWDAAMRVFWGGFGTALDRQVALRAGGAAPARWRLRPTAALAGLGLAAGLALGARR